jgi:hypothetical protein
MPAGMSKLRVSHELWNVVAPLLPHDWLNRF